MARFDLTDFEERVIQLAADEGSGRKRVDERRVLNDHLPAVAHEGAVGGYTVSL
jgi:hypothetical protein